MADPSKVVDKWIQAAGYRSFNYSDRVDQQPENVQKFNPVKLDETVEKLLDNIYKWCKGERKTKPQFNDVVVCLGQYLSRNNNMCNKLVPHVPALDDLNFIWDNESRITVSSRPSRNAMWIDSYAINKWYERFSKHEGDMAQLADELITDCIAAPSSIKFAKAAALMVLLNERKNNATTTTTP